MAIFEVEGMDSLEKFFGNIAAVPNEVANKMLHAQADIVVKAQKQTARTMLSGPYSIGDTEKAIKKGRITNSRNGKSIKVIFVGSRKRGNTTTSNAEIAFLNEYGNPRRGIKARQFIRTANEQCADEALNAADKIFEEFLDSL